MVGIAAARKNEPQITIPIPRRTQAHGFEEEVILGEIYCEPVSASRAGPRGGNNLLFSFNNNMGVKSVAHCVRSGSSNSRQGDDGVPGFVGEDIPRPPVALN